MELTLILTEDCNLRCTYLLPKELSYERGTRGIFGLRDCPTQKL